MKIFIFKRIEQVSGNWHPEGGLVIIEMNKRLAKNIIKRDSDIRITEDEWKEVEIYDLKDSSMKPDYIVFPDAGCC